MDAWAPLWSKIVDSSLWTEPLHVRVLFVTMMALKDRDHVVRFNAFGLSQRAHMSEKEVMDGLKVLQAPDKKRLEKQDFDGRRVKKVDGGWLLLNGEKYRELMGLVQKERRAITQYHYRQKKKAELAGSMAMIGGMGTKEEQNAVANEQ